MPPRRRARSQAVAGGALPRRRKSKPTLKTAMRARRLPLPPEPDRRKVALPRSRSIPWHAKPPTDARRASRGRFDGRQGRS